MVYVDDLHACGPREPLVAIISELGKHLVIKASGPFQSADSYTFLRQSRLVREDAVYIVPDESYVLECQKDLLLDEYRPASMPGLQDRALLADGEVVLEGSDVRLYRSCVGRLLYLSHSRADIQYTVRLLCTRLTAPRKYELRALRHLVRYCAGTRRLAMKFEKADRCIGFDFEIELKVFADADWAGGPGRKSSSGGIVTCDRCPLHSWSKGQSVTAKSSAESEFYALCLATDEGLGYQSLLQSIGLSCRVHVLTDNSAALAQACRLGAGSNMKHVQVRYFWIQETLASRRMKLSKTPGTTNIADLLAKAVTARVLQALREPAGLVDMDTHSIAFVSATSSTTRSTPSSAGLDLNLEKLGTQFAALVMLLRATLAEGAHSEVAAHTRQPTYNEHVASTTTWLCIGFFALVGVLACAYGLFVLCCLIRRRLLRGRRGLAPGLLEGVEREPPALAARPLPGVRLVPTTVYVMRTGTKWHSALECSAVQGHSTRALTNCSHCASTPSPEMTCVVENGTVVESGLLSRGHAKTRPTF
jgi:hypothetical protein